MELIKFSSNDVYLRAQGRTQKQKRGENSFCQPIEIKKIARHCKTRRIRPKLIMCHGARLGHELRMFEEAFPKATVMGSDLFPKGQAVVEHDFRNRAPGWVGKFDIIYSNSWDHSDEPEETLRVWIEQLTPKGVGFICWTPWHVKAVGGDCFGAELREYYEMIDRIGEVQEVLHFGGCCFLLAFTKRRRRRRRGIE